MYAKETSMINKKECIAAFEKVGLQKDDIVLVHSALRALGPIDGKADTIIDALCEVIGPKGILAIPTHTFSVVNVKQPVFHQSLTPSNVGALTNVFRKRPGVIRGLHPTHSIAALGPRAAEFVSINAEDGTPCPLNSPYGRLREWGGKVLILGAKLSCCTFFHGCEEWAELPTAFNETPVQLYSITEQGEHISMPSYQHATNTWDQYPRLEPALLDIGALHIETLGEGELRLLDAKITADWLVPLLREDPSIIYQ